MYVRSFFFDIIIIVIGGYSGFIWQGCGHPILYDDNGDIIEHINDLIIDCIERNQSIVVL